MNASTGAEYRLQNMFSVNAQLLEIYVTRTGHKTEAIGLLGGFGEDCGLYPGGRASNLA